MKQRGFLEEAGLAVAEAVASDRAFAAAVLIASTLFLRDARWDVGAMFLAGAAVSRSSLKTRWIVFLLMAGVARGTDSGFTARHWSDLDLMAPAYTTNPRYLRVALLLMAGGAGMRSPGFWLLGAALGIAAPLVRFEPVESSFPLAWSVMSLGLAVLSAARRPRFALSIAIATFVVASLFDTVMSGWPLPTAKTLASHGAGVITETAFFMWPVIAGLATAALREPLERSDAVRLAGLAQRHPWRVLSIVAAFVVVFGGPSFPLGDSSRGSLWSLESLAALCLGSTLLISLAARAQSFADSLAAPFWISAALLTAWGSLNTWWDREVEVQLLALTALAAIGPLALVRSGRCAQPRWVISYGLPLLLTLLVAQPWSLMPGAWQYSSRGSASAWLWLALVPVAFQVATLLTVSSRRIVLVATALGVVSWLALVVGGESATRYELTTMVGVWFLGGVYVVMARRANGLTAVPLDHPSVAEARPAAPDFVQGP